MNAEDAQFFPSAGPVLLAQYPEGVRVDAAVETGSVVGTDYDSMIAKVIAHGPDRRPRSPPRPCVGRHGRSSASDNDGFLRRLLARDDVRAGRMDTGLVGASSRPRRRSPTGRSGARRACRDRARGRARPATTRSPA